MDAKSRTFRLSTKIIQVTGEIDMKSAPRLREKLRRTLDQKPQAVMLKLSDVTYMDSAGVAVLVEAHQWAKRERIIFTLADPSPAARAVIEMARLMKFFVVTGDVDGAE